MAGRLQLGCTMLAICLSGCGPLLYPEGTFRSGCPALPVLFPTPSDLAGTWSGTVTVTGPSTGETSDESISVTFDQFGQPVGNDDPWPAEWPGCFVAGAKIERITTVCNDPWRLPQQQDVETITLSTADFTADSTQLAWCRWLSRARCPEGHYPAESEQRTYTASVAGDTLSWSARFESGSVLGPATVTEVQGQLYRQ